MNSQKPDILSYPSKTKRPGLSQSQLETLRAGTLRILQEVGVRFPTQKALSIFADHGAEVDGDTQIVTIAPDFVEKAMPTMGFAAPATPWSALIFGNDEVISILVLIQCADEIYTSDNPRPSREIALEEFKRINETHHPEPLPKEILVELDRILTAADKEAEKLN